jgi:hypothetical protein
MVSPPCLHAISSQLMPMLLDYENKSFNAVLGSNRCSEIRTKLINTLCGHNVAFFNF